MTADPPSPPQAEPAIDDGTIDRREPIAASPRFEPADLVRAGVWVER